MTEHEKQIIAENENYEELYNERWNISELGLELEQMRAEMKLNN